MLAFKERFESPKTICKKIGALITLHFENNNLIDRDNCHKVTNKHIFPLGKLDET
jgi:hypothetical protein